MQYRFAAYVRSFVTSFVALGALSGVYGCSSDAKKADALTDPGGGSPDGGGANGGTDGTDPDGTDPSGSGGGGGGDDAGPGTGGDPDAGPDVGSPATIPFSCPAGTIVNGLNEKFTVNGKSRKFIADFPADTSRPMAVLFSFYGFGDNADNFRKVLSFNPDQDPNVPTIIITPTGTGLLPPAGLDWDITKGKETDKNADIPLFEGILGCLAAQQNIDASRIYAFGFSAGAVMTNLIYSRHPNVLAAVVTESGAWMNDGAERKLVNLPGISWSWPDLASEDRGNVLLTHGGPKDVTDLNLLDLEKSAQAAIPFLGAAQRTVIDCAHDKGHHLHPEILPGVIASYLYAHRLGQPSPYAGGDISAFPSSCTLHLPTAP